MQNVKNDFPLLANSELIYLDSAATTQKPQVVIDAVVNFYATANAPVKRGLYDLAERATDLYEQARQRIAQFIGADADEIIFTRGATEGLNFVAATWGQKNIKAGDEILLSELEHHANLLPWQHLAREKGAVLKFIPVDDNGMLKMETISTLISSKTKMVSVLNVSNFIGTHVDVGPIIKAARAVGAKILIDACQSVPYEPCDVRELDCDFLVFSGHKTLGPTGIGVLYIKKEIQKEVPPYQRGGGTVFEVSYQEATFLEPPHCYEAGTPPVAQAIGLAAAVEYIDTKIGRENLKKHTASLCARLIDGLAKIPKIRVLGPVDQLHQSGHLVSFVHEDIHPHDVAAYLSAYGICMRAGHYCAQPLARRLGVEGAVRASFYAYSSEQDVDRVVEVLSGMAL